MADLEDLPQWGRLGGQEITGCNSAFRSDYFSYPDWVDASQVGGVPFDASQQFICTAPVAIDHLALDSSELENQPFLVDAVIEGFGHALNPDQIWINYKSQSDEPWTQVGMSYAGQGHWQATIPGQAQPAEIAYFIHAENIEGEWREDPPGGDLDPYRFEVAWIVEAFEEDDAGFTVDPDGDDTAVAGIWERVTPSGSCVQPTEDHTSVGTFCWMTQDNDGDQPRDVDGGTTTLASPNYELLGAVSAKLKYRRWYWAQNPTTDYWLVQARNNGSAWLDLEHTVPASGEWEEVEVDLLDLFGFGIGTVELRFVARDEGGDSVVEAAIDDISILVEFRDPSGVTKESEGTPRTDLTLCTPNPSDTGMEIRYVLASPGPVRLTIHDIAGRLVRTLITRTVSEPGEHVASWNRLDDLGRQAGNGLYLLQLTTVDGVRSRKVILLD